MIPSTSLFLKFKQVFLSNVCRWDPREEPERRTQKQRVFLIRDDGRVLGPPRRTSPGRWMILEISWHFSQNHNVAFLRHSNLITASHPCILARFACHLCTATKCDFTLISCTGWLIRHRKHHKVPYDIPSSETKTRLCDSPCLLAPRTPTEKLCVDASVLI